MTVTSLATSRAIYEALGWAGTEKVWRYSKPTKLSEVKYRAEQEADDYRFRNSREAPRYHAENEIIPAYELSFLLERLPYPILDKTVYDKWHCKWGKRTKDGLTKPMVESGFADNPTEAAGLLVIALAASGILQKDPTHE